MTKLKCLKCGDIIESKFRHDFKWCSCENIFIDGGNDYIRMGGDGLTDNSFNFWNERLEIWEKIINEK